MTSGYSIHPVETSDVPVLVNLLYLLRTSLIFNRVLFKDWPNEPAQKALYRSTIESTLTPDSTIEGLKVVDETGEIIGYVAISHKFPKDSTEQQHSNTEAVNESHEEKTDDLNGIHPDVYDAAVKACLALQQKNDAYEHLSTCSILFGCDLGANAKAGINYIGVKPTSRKLGIGAKLMGECFSRARKAGLPLALDAEPEAVDFYLKLGFTETGHASIDLARWATPNSGFGSFRWTGMIWYP